MWRAVRAACSSLDFDPSPTELAFLHALRRKDCDGLRLYLQTLWLAAAVRRRGIDHLHAHFATSATAAAVMAHMLSGVSFSFTPRTFITRTPTKTWSPKPSSARPSR